MKKKTDYNDDINNLYLKDPDEMSNNNENEEKNENINNKENQVNNEMNSNINLNEKSVCVVNDIKESDRSKDLCPRCCCCCDCACYCCCCDKNISLFVKIFLKFLLVMMFIKQVVLNQIIINVLFLNILVFMYLMPLLGVIFF